MGKSNVYVLTVLAVILSAFAIIEEPLKIGDKAPLINHRVEDISGRTLTLAESAGRNGLLVMFTSNTCPWVARWEDRFNELQSLAQANGIGMIALNSNERIRNRGESMEEMRKRAQKQNYNFPYALDKNHELADAFGATRTPELFLFDRNLTLVYHGAIDGNAADAAKVTNKYAQNAINAMISGNSIENQLTKLLGCTIKRTE